jgi:hypothetical protein
MMSRWFLGLLTISAAVVAVALALARPGGSGNHESLAHMITALPTVTGTPGAPAFHAEIDTDAWNGTSPCNPVDTSANVQIGVAHDIAVCLTSAMAPTPSPANGVAKFKLDVIYDPDLNSCVNKNCNKMQPCTEDDMPDANEGSTLGQGVPTVPDLGGGWDCSIFHLTEPSCAGGKATIACSSLSGPFPPTGPGVSFPLFAVTFTAIGGGIDNMTLANVQIYDKLSNALGSCNPVLEGEPELPCFGATEVNIRAVGGITGLPDIAESAGGSSPLPNSALAALVAAGALVLVVGGWYARRRWLR